MSSLRLPYVFLLFMILSAPGLEARKKPLDPGVYDTWKAVKEVSLSADGSFLTYRIVPQAGESSLVLHRTEDGTERVLPGVKSVLSGADAQPYVAYFCKKGAVVLDPAAGFRADTVFHALSGSFSREGTKLVLTLAGEDPGSRCLLLYDAVSGEKRVLDSGKAFYGSACWDDASGQCVFLASENGSASSGGPCGIYLWGKGRGVRTLVPETWRSEDGKGFTRYAAPFFSHSGTRILAGMSVLPSQAPSEPDGPDVWRWDEILTPPMRKVAGLERRTFLSVITVADGTVVPLSDSYEDTVLYPGDGEYALLYNDSPYRIASYWEANPFSKWKSDPHCDVFLVSLRDGSRRELRHGMDGTPRLSPGGQYVLWHSRSDQGWHTLHLATGKEVNLTENLPYPFYDEENDIPQPPVPWDFHPLWTVGDETLLLCDRYDVWQFSPDGGTPVCLTQQDGRRRGIRYRTLGADRAPGKKDRLFLTCFSEQDKTNGLAVLEGLKPQIPDGFTAACSYERVVVSRDGKTMAFTRGDFSHPYDLYLLQDPARGRRKSLQERMDRAQRLTALNPEQSDYRWGEVSLVHWKAYDGTPLDGLLFVPEDREAEEKLPLLVFFYERMSHTRYDYRPPAPSSAWINIPYYVSNGYAVFVPDVVYRIGHPGESARNCICSGVEAMWRQFPFLDAERTGVQGHSWGGYQVAYLLTCTDLFKAAVSGAPVVNMTSAYGGLRTQSGLARIMLYESGQSRIGKSIWEEGALDLYEENSPLFRADRIRTPVLIMTSDTDDKVPWTQSIEFFSALRRLGKPAWMLQYHGETHDLGDWENRKDYSLRLMQFFDFYLKGSPLPTWMGCSEGSAGNQ